MSQELLIKTVQTKYELKALQEEIDSLLHWRGQLERILTGKPEGIAPLLTQVKKVADMMGNRVQTLKKELREKGGG